MRSDQDPIIKKWLSDPRKARKFHMFVTISLVAAMLGLAVGGIIFLLALAGYL